MTLRIMLVGLVASLGFELPSGADVSSWTQASTAWVRTAMLDRSGPGVEAKPDLAAPSDCRQVDEESERLALAREADATTDAAFLAMSEGMAAELAADVRADHRPGRPGDQVEAILTLEGPAPATLAEGEEAGCLLPHAAAADSAEVAAMEPDASADLDDSAVATSELSDRVSSAVRLTREAVNAWAAVIQQAAEECQPTR